MMTNYFKIFGFSLVIVLAAWVQAEEAISKEKTAKETQETKKEQALKKEALYLVSQFASTLQAHLKTAMFEKGVEAAIEVCSVKAPEVAANLSRDFGWQIKRVSLKARNQSTAIPDEWETSGLEYFEKHKAEEPLLYTAITDKEYRLMKAQKVGGLCLTCHGTALSDEVKSSLKKYYPDDKATGYMLGEIRGAFSLRKAL